MKVSFITIHIGLNFGSILQTIATSELLKRIGCEPLCVNYWPPRTTNDRYWKESVKSPQKLVWRLFYFPFRAISQHRFSKYLSRFCRVSKPIFSKDKFEAVCPQADVYVSGSDQIWNYNHNEGIDGHYFFEGIEGRKVAFASSIGITSISDDYSDYMGEMLSKYDAISVREESAVNLLRKIGIQSEQLIDPTLAIERNEWKKFASKRLFKEDYLFVYLPYNTVDKDVVYETARKIAMMRGLKVITYSTSAIVDSSADKTIKWCNPGDILSLILNADFVITNSFHGTAFSINLNKQFVVFMPSNFSTRISSLLKLTGLEDRLVNDILTEDIIGDNINFDYANSILAAERKKSIGFLKKNIINVLQ